MNIHLAQTRRIAPASTPAKKTPQAVDVAVGARVRLLRVTRGMSQTALGEHLGITFQQIQKYEKGTNRIGSSRLAQIAKVLDVPVSTLFETVAQGTGEAPVQFSAMEVRFILALRRLPSGVAAPILNMIEALQNEGK